MDKKTVKNAEYTSFFARLVDNFNTRLWATWYGKIFLILFWTPILIFCFVTISLDLFLFPHTFFGKDFFELANDVHAEFTGNFLLSEGYERALQEAHEKKANSKVCHYPLSRYPIISKYPLSYFEGPHYWITLIISPPFLTNLFLFLLCLFLYDNKDKVKQILCDFVFFIRHILEPSKNKNFAEILTLTYNNIREMKYKKDGVLRKVFLCFRWACFYTFLVRLIPLPDRII